MPLNTASSSSPNNIIRVFGYSSMECGYCKGDRAHLVNKTATDCSKSYGMLADYMSADMYERFLERGWRRSGIHLYKPCNFESCCPTLTIRMLAPKFEITKSQQKVANKMKNLLQPPKTKPKQKKTSSLLAEQAVLESSGMLQALQDSTQKALQNCLEQSDQNWNISFKARKASKQDQKQGHVQAVSSICAQVAGKLQLNREELVQKVVSAMHTPIPKSGVAVASMESHQPSGQIVVTLRMEELAKPDVPMPDASQAEENDKLARWYKKATGKALKQEHRQLEITTLAAHESALLPEVHKLYALYQHVVHEDPDPYIGINPSNMEEQPDPINIEDLDWGNAPAYFTRHIPTMLQKHCQEYPEERRTAILSNYYSFYQFLVESPFPLDDEQPSLSPACGTYHQHYKIGGMLVAVGVVDILPKGFSSVYLFYLPSFSHDLVALGKYAILKEVDYTNQALKLPYYYLGYYIESCPKMRYKGEYKPSELLCPKNYQWVNAEDAVSKLQQTPVHVCALVEESNAKKKPLPSNVLERIPMDIGGDFNVTLNMLQDSGKRVVQPILEDFLQEAGPELSQECLLKLT